MSSQFKSFSIGVFVLAALGLLVWALLWVRPQIGNERQILYVRFTNIDKVNVGTRVLFAGQPVGEVAEIREVRDARVDTIQGRVYIFLLKLKIDSDVDVYTTDQISIKTSGLLGERAVDITPLPPQPGKPFERATKEDVLNAATSGSVEEAFSQINRLSTNVEKVFEQVGDIFKDLDKNHFWENLSSGAKNFEEVTQSINRPEDWKETLNNLHDFSKNVKESWKKIDAGLEDVAKAAEGFTDVAALAKDIMQSIEEGKGSIGSIIMKDDFYLQIKAIMTKVETLMDDINHYGVLFNTDKRWQRQRERRASQICKLSTPQQFRNYFTDEVDQIATALTRITAVINEADDKCCQFDCNFEKVFADLLRRVKCLDELLKKFNQELRGQEEACCGCPPCGAR